MYYIFLVLSGAAVFYASVKAICAIGVFPGQLFAKPKNMKNFKSDAPGQTLTFSKETTSQNRILHSVRIEPENKTGSVIIIFNGLNATFRNEKKLRTYCQLAKDTGHTVIGFDYGGTGMHRISTWSHYPLVNDGWHMVLKVAKEMPDHGNLILKGNSLGGAIATKVAKRCHNINIKAYLWNGRSFKSVSATIAGYIRTFRRSGYYKNRLTKLISAVCLPFISLILRLTKCEIDVAEDYKNIPAAYKNYYIVRSDKNGRLTKKDDVMIPHCATFESDEEIKKNVKNVIKTGNIDDPNHLAYYYERRKVISELPGNAHATPENELFCRKDTSLSAYYLFCKFSTEYIESHSEKCFKKSEFTFSRQGYL